MTNIGTRLDKLEKITGGNDESEKLEAALAWLRNAIGPYPRPVPTPEEKAEVDQRLAAIFAAIANEGRKDD